METTPESTCRHLGIVDLLERDGEATCLDCGRQVFLESTVTEAVRKRRELNPLALSVALIGAVVIVVGLFLPANENPGFGGLEKNTLIQQGLVVWSVVIFGTVFALDLARAYQQRRTPSWFELIFPIGAAGTSAHLLNGSTLALPGHQRQARHKCPRRPCGSRDRRVRDSGRSRHLCPRHHRAEPLARTRDASMPRLRGERARGGDSLQALRPSS